MFDDTMTVEAARAVLREEAAGGGGAHCPVCTQFSKVYPRKLNSTMVRALVYAYRRKAFEPYHMPTLFGSRAGGDLAKPRYWGLIAELPLEREDGGRAGWYTVTPRGAAFLTSGFKVPKYALTYNREVLGYDGPAVTAADCLGKRFDLRELMTTRVDAAPPL